MNWGTHTKMTYRPITQWDGGTVPHTCTRKDIIVSPVWLCGPDI